MKKYLLLLCLYSLLFGFSHVNYNVTPAIQESDRKPTQLLIMPTIPEHDYDIMFNDKAISVGQYNNIFNQDFFDNLSPEKYCNADGVEIPGFSNKIPGIGRVVTSPTVSVGSNECNRGTMYLIYVPFCQKDKIPEIPNFIAPNDEYKKFYYNKFYNPDNPSANAAGFAIPYSPSKPYDLAILLSPFGYGEKNLKATVAHEVIHALGSLGHTWSKNRLSSVMKYVAICVIKMKYSFSFSFKCILPK